MKLTLQSSILSSKVSEAFKVIPQKTPIAILSTFLVSAADNELSITAYDGENRLTLTIPAVVDAPGNVCVDARFFATLTKKLPDGPITLVAADGSLSIKSLSGTYRTPYQEAGVYPDAEPMDVAQSVQFPAGVLATGLASVMFAAGRDEFHLAMTGVCVDCSANGVRFYATDSRKLARYVIPDAVNADMRFILPIKAIQSLIPQCNGAVSLRATSTAAEFSGDGFTLRCQLIAGRYPDAERVIPTGRDTIVTAKRQALINAVRRAAVCADGNYQLVRMAFRGDTVDISTRNLESGREGQESMPCDIGGNPIIIGFSAENFLSVLSAVSSENVTIAMTDPSHPAVISPDDSDALTLLSMPMTINE